MTIPLQKKTITDPPATENSERRAQGVLPNSRTVNIQTSTATSSIKPTASFPQNSTHSGLNNRAHTINNGSEHFRKVAAETNTQKAVLKDKGYFLEVGEKGKERLDILNNLSNDSSKDFLRKIGLSPGMNVLEIGCGTGEMSVWLAKQVLPNGKVIAIDNSSEQIRISRELAKKENISNIDFRVDSAYNLNSLELKDQLDVVFSRYVFIHLVDHLSALNAIKGLLKPGSGSVVIQDLIVSHIFSYPESEVINQWRTLNLTTYNHYNKDPDFGKKLVSFCSENGLDVVDYEYNHPLLKTEHEKLQMVRGLFECEKLLLEQKIASKEKIDLMIHKLKEVAKDNRMVVSFMPNMIVAGRRKE